MLETWGEIAQHLGIEVRTAQRWESRLGLPVRRMAGGQAVFAFVHELDAWRTGRESPPRGSADDTAPGAGRIEVPAAPPPSPPIPSTPPDVPGPRTTSDGVEHRASRSPMVFVVAVALVLALAAWWFTGSRSAQQGILTTLAFDGSTLVALDAVGRPLWRHALPATTTALDVDPLRRPGLTSWWERLDVEGDGVDELVVLVDGYRTPSTASESILCFALDGTLRWAVTPEVTLPFAKEAFTGPWDVFDLEAVPGHGLWVAFAHVPWWPSGILRIDGDGLATLQYVQPGTVRLLRRVDVATGMRVWAAGVNNEHASASVALLDPTRPVSAPPSGGGPYACLRCPPGLPEGYTLLLPSAVNRASHLPYNGVIDVKEIAPGALLEVATQEVPRVNVTWRLTPSLDVRRVEPTDSYWKWRPDGAVDTPWPAKRGHPTAALVRTWRAGVWTETAVSYSGIDE